MSIEQPDADLTAFVEVARCWLKRVHYKDWILSINWQGIHSIYMQGGFDAPNVETGQVEWTRTRKWLLSRHMTRSEVIQTAFKLVMTAEEHETRERFLYRGEAVFQPHYDIEDLVKLQRAESKDVRDGDNR